MKNIGLALTSNPVLAHCVIELANSALLGLCAAAHVSRAVRAPGRRYSPGMGLLLWAGAVVTGLHAAQPMGVRFFGEVASLQEFLPWTGTIAGMLIAAGLTSRRYDLRRWGHTRFIVAAVAILAYATGAVWVSYAGLLPTLQPTWVPRPLDLALAGVFGAVAWRQSSRRTLRVGAGLMAVSHGVICLSPTVFDGYFWAAHFTKHAACWALLLSVELDW